MDQGLQITVGANVQQLVGGMQAGVQSVQSMEKELAALDLAIIHALDKGENVAKLEKAFDDLVARIKSAKAAIAQPVPVPPIPAPDDTAFLNTITKQRIAFTDLGRIVTGQGFSLRSLASNFALLGPGITIAAAAIYGLVELFSKQTDAEKKASEEAKKLAETLLNLKDAQNVTETSTGSEAGNIARVQALAAAIQDSNKSYAERKNALDELRETNKAYFGDLTLEAASMATLSARARDYSNALITEAIVKGQVEEIAKVSSELEVQAQAYERLKDARERAQTAVDKQGPIASSAGNVAGGGADVLSNKALDTLDAANVAFEKQRDVVLQLRTAIATYEGELDKAIAEQIQQKPLTVPPKYTDDLKSIIPILEQIKKIYDDLSKPSKLPLFEQLANSTNQNDITLIQTQIKEAIKKGATDGAKDPEVRQAYDNLATALRAKLSALQNPNLSSRVRGTVDVTADDVSALESKIEKSLGTKGLELKVPVHLKEAIEGNSAFDDTDKQTIEKGLQRDIGLAHLFVNATVDVQISIGKALIKEEELRKLRDVIDKTLTNSAEAGFKDVGIAIGDALAGAKNPLQKAVQDFTNILGEGLIKIGEQMIAASAIMQALKATLGTLFENPAGGLVLGIATVALGEVVKSVGAHAFATGGIVTGPTFGMVGEAGPEVIFPLSQLNRFVKNSTVNGPQRVFVTGTIRGRDLAITQARDSKLQNLAS